MTRVLILGVSGMFGHRAARAWADRFEVWGSCRTPARLPDLGVPADRLLAGLDASDATTAAAAIRAASPDVVVNAVGIVKQDVGAKQAVPSILVNALFPHLVAEACAESGARLLHLSTDCVFSGERGLYTEDDTPDATDLYGRTKLLGEVATPGCLTMRTSIIGWQLSDFASLMEWFAAHRAGPVGGYRRAVFSGLTTEALAGVMARVIEEHPRLSGLYHVAAEPIDKLDLLTRARDALGWDTEIRPVDEPAIDRSLDGSRFTRTTGIVAPPWDEMLSALAADRAWYEALAR